MRDKSSVVPEHLRGAPEHVLFSEALRHIWPDDVHSRLQYGLYLTSILQSQYGHQRALQLLLVVLEIPRIEKCSLTVDQIQQCLTTLSRLAPALLLETTLQLYQALFASLQRGSATRLLEQFFHLAEQNGWQFTPLDQDRVTQLQMLHSNRRRVASFTALITTRFSTAAGLQNRNSVSAAIYRRGQPLSNSLLFEAAADLLIHARRIWQRAGINWVCPSPSVLTSSQLCAAWDTVLPAAIPELSLMASLWDQAEIVHSVTLAAELLLQADRPLDALQITDLLKNQDISPLAGGRITTAEHFAFVFSAAMAENSLIPILRFARVHATAVSRTKPTVNGAELLESFLSSSQSLREYPATWWLRELQPPERILHVTTWIRLAPARDSMRLSICRRLIQEIQQLSEEALHNTADRTSFWRQLQDTRVVIVNACLEHLDDLPAQAATEREKLYIELTIWLEILDNRVLYETVILQKAFEPQRADTQSHRYPEQADSTRPINESLSGQWEFILQSDDEQLQSWLSDLRQCMLSAQKLSTALTTFEGDAGEDPAFQQATDRLPDPEHLLDQDQLQPEEWKLLLAKICDVPDLHQLLPVNSLLIRATFDSAGRLHWWALHHTGNGSIRLAGCHISEAGAREVIAAASEAADAQIAAVWIRLQQLSRQQTDIHGQSPAASQSQSDWDWLVTKLDQLQIPVEELHHKRWTRCKRSWPRLTALLTAPVVTDVTYKPAQPDLKPQVRQEIWEKCRKILASSPPCDLWAAWKDETLNSICSVQQRICSWFFDLTPLKLRPQELAGCSILTATEGPLLPIPVTWLPFHGAPLFTHCHSATATISLLLHRQKQSHTKPVMRQQPATLCTLWEQPKKRRSMGIPLFYRGLQALLQSRSQTQAVRLQTLCDTPIATPDNLAACTIGQAFDLLVVAGHGVAARQGIQLAGAAGGTSSQIWRGSGDFQHCGLIVLMACSMGRLHQYNHTEVDGLYASIVAHGGRSVIAPRWDVDDVMSATFLLDFLCLLPADFRELQQQPIGPVFNAARKKAWQSWVDSMSTQQAAEICCHHTLAAYEFFGW